MQLVLLSAMTLQRHPENRPGIADSSMLMTSIDRSARPLSAGFRTEKPKFNFNYKVPPRNYVANVKFTKKVSLQGIHSSTVTNRNRSGYCVLLQHYHLQ